VCPARQSNRLRSSRRYIAIAARFGARPNLQAVRRLEHHTVEATMRFARCEYEDRFIPNRKFSCADGMARPTRGIRHSPQSAEDERRCCAAPICGCIFLLSNCRNDLEQVFSRPHSEDTASEASQVCLAAVGVIVLARRRGRHQAISIADLCQAHLFRDFGRGPTWPLVTLAMFSHPTNEGKNLGANI